MLYQLNFHPFSGICVVKLLLNLNFYKPKITRPKHKSARNIYSVQFQKKAVEIMNLLYILNNTGLTHTLKGLNTSFTTPTVK